MSDVLEEEPNCARAKRMAVGGFWKEGGLRTDVSSGDKIIGFRRAFVFCRGKGTNGKKKSDWMMQEVSCNDPPGSCSSNVRRLPIRPVSLFLFFN